MDRFNVNEGNPASSLHSNNSDTYSHTRNASNLLKNNNSSSITTSSHANMSSSSSSSSNATNRITSHPTDSTASSIIVLNPLLHYKKPDIGGGANGQGIIIYT